MPWTPLKDRLINLPLILAGPILRHTEPESVTVWVALKESRTMIMLTVQDAESGNFILSGGRGTVALGKNLHVAALTASPLGEARLQPGKIYKYDLVFGDSQTLSSPNILNKEGDISKITYQPTFNLPTFALPPEEINDLRIIQGSCRKPHADGMDAMPGLDRMIKSTHSNPLTRPHQLFLTGDQIYADDVADVLLRMMMDASEALIGWPENLGIDDVNKLLPGNRSVLIDEAGLSGGVKLSIGGGLLTTVIALIETFFKHLNFTKSHTVKLGEFYAMYLFNFSDTIWPEELPKYEDVLPMEPERPRLKKRIFNKERKAVEEFRKVQPGVRRALANIPTYMAIDDHEAVDDWYLDEAWCRNALGNPLGRQIIQNGSIAYALFQDWGNQPNSYRNGLPGEEFLTHIATWSETTGYSNETRQKINRLVGVPEDPDEILKKDDEGFPHLIRPERSLDWNYRLRGPKYEVIVLDTRTHRSFNRNNSGKPSLLIKSALIDQIAPVAPTGVELTIVISQGPIFFFPAGEGKQKRPKRSRPNYLVDAEQWFLDNFAFESILGILASRERVLFLSGDIHFSYVGRMQYWARKPFIGPDPPAQSEFTTVFAQLTASAVKNEDWKTRTLHSSGFTPLKRLPHPLMFGGWSNPGGGPLRIGTMETFTVENNNSGIGATVPQPKSSTVARNLRGNPAVTSIGDPETLEIIPEWVYRIDYVRDERVITARPNTDPEILPPFSPKSDRKAGLSFYLSMGANYKKYAKEFGAGKEIVGVNSIGEITFNWKAGDEKEVIQTFWWRLNDPAQKGMFLDPLPLTEFKVSMSQNDPKYKRPEIKINLRTDV
jgi:hypothetical protein